MRRQEKAEGNAGDACNLGKVSRPKNGDTNRSEECRKGSMLIGKGDDLLCFGHAEHEESS